MKTHQALDTADQEGQRDRDEDSKPNMLGFSRSKSALWMPLHVPGMLGNERLETRLTAFDQQATSETEREQRNKQKERERQIEGWGQIERDRLPQKTSMQLQESGERRRRDTDVSIKSSRYPESRSTSR